MHNTFEEIKNKYKQKRQNDFANSWKNKELSIRSNPSAKICTFESPTQFMRVLPLQCPS
jgi:hypothetical protein